jgi:hypothetical protein
LKKQFSVEGQQSTPFDRAKPRFVPRLYCYASCASQNFVIGQTPNIPPLGDWRKETIRSCATLIGHALKTGGGIRS